MTPTQRPFFIGLIYLALPSFVMAVDVISPVPGGTPLFPGEAESKLYLSERPEYGSKQLVPAEGVPFSRAVELRTLKQPAEAWDFQLSEKIPTAIHQGDVLWVSLWMRSTETSNETQEGLSQVSLESSAPPWDNFDSYDLSAGKDWQQFAWVCTANRDFAPGEAHICLRGGYQPQVIQIGGIQIIDYGPDRKITELPRSKSTYPGMEADAPWRKAAADRIERYRKADVKIVVKDAAGQPLAGATVHLQQMRHAFGFGSAVVARLIEGSGPDNDRYREIIKNNFSKVVMENDLKWSNWDAGAEENHQTTLTALHWLQDQGISIRGHNLIWPSWRHTPHQLFDLQKDFPAMEQTIEAHFKDEVTTTRGQLTEWDVVNEPYTNHDILDLAPPDIMTTWFKLARQLDPRPVLFLNDYAGLTNRGNDTPHKDAFEKTLNTLKAQGAPIGGLGLQSHFGHGLTGPEQLVKELDRWAALGLDIQITEFDLNFDDEDLQAQYTRDFMTAVFSHPSVSALLMWGFWEKAHWIPKAALYRSDWSIKPNGRAWLDLVQKEWHTDITATSDASGTVSCRGFMGQYQVTVTYHGKTTTLPLTLPKEGAVLTATVPAN